MNKILILTYLIQVLVILRNLVLMAMLGRAISSFFVSPYSSRGWILQFLYDVTDPFIKVARLIPHRFAMMDFSLFIAMLMVDFGGRALVILLTKLA